MTKVQVNKGKVKISISTSNKTSQISKNKEPNIVTVAVKNNINSSYKIKSDDSFNQDVERKKLLLKKAVSQGIIDNNKKEDLREEALKKTLKEEAALEEISHELEEAPAFVEELAIKDIPDLSHIVKEVIPPKIIKDDLDNKFKKSKKPVENGLVDNFEKINFEKPKVKKTSFKKFKFNSEPPEDAILQLEFVEKAEYEVKEPVIEIKKRKKLNNNKKFIPTTKLHKEIELYSSISVSEFANLLSEKVADVIKNLMKLGVMAKMHDIIDLETAQIIAETMGHKVKKGEEYNFDFAFNKIQEKSKNFPYIRRSPIVTIMGHVDHGKTSLLDALRLSNLTEKESGGITQHIGAYEVNSGIDNRKITFLDTPGHEAFTQMRARGANVTDIVILVVAADDGVMVQTIEAISHAKAANVPIIVAINKIDKPGANPKKVLNELLAHNIVAEEFGGEVMAIEISAQKKINLDKLIEAIILQADMLDLKAQSEGSATGAVIEGKLDKNNGVLVSILIQSGSLKIGDIIVAGDTYGKIRKITDSYGKTIREANVAMPVEISGFNKTPSSGEKFLILDSEKEARDLVDYNINFTNSKKIDIHSNKSANNLFNNTQDRKVLNLIIKSDVYGSAEAIAASIDKIEHKEVEVKILHKASGAITDSDVTLAMASKAMIIAFNVRGQHNTLNLASQNKVDIRYYSIIYNIIDDVRDLVSGMLSKLKEEKITGHAEIRNVFNITKVGKVAGCYILDGILKRGSNVRIIRDNIVIYESKIKAIKRFKDDVKEVKENFECGITLTNYSDYKEGDKLEAFDVSEHSQILQ